MQARLALLLFTAVAPIGATADLVSGAPKLAWPVDCVLGETCHIQNYVDHDPSPNWHDVTCNALTYDGHTGTDIALATRAEVAAGVKVRAAAAGVVTATRDTMPDRLYQGEDLAGRGCGNGVVIDHGDGWVTQYCHLRQGSVRVAEGTAVETGALLGEIGLSGRTEFPHVEFAVRHNGVPVDPFAPNGADNCAISETETLWNAPVPYVPGGLLDLGFATGVPAYDAVKAGTATTAMTTSDPVVLFALGYGFQDGDALNLTIIGPDGAVFTFEHRFERFRAQAFQAAGRPAPEAGWPAGPYLGRVDLIRDGALISQKIIRTELP